MNRMILAFILLIAPLAAPLRAAPNDVALTSEMFIERTMPVPGGKPRVVLDKPKSVPPGAKLVFVLTYRNQGKAPATNFVVTNPMPAGVAFEGTADAGAIVSVDHGVTYGPLAMAKVRGDDGLPHAARPEDVTHVRWVLKAPIPVGGTGKLSFRGTVK